MTVTATGSTELIYGLPVNTLSLLTRARAFAFRCDASIALGIIRNRSKAGTLQCSLKGKNAGDLPKEVGDLIVSKVWTDLVGYYESKEREFGRPEPSHPRSVTCICDGYPCKAPDQHFRLSSAFSWLPQHDKSVKAFLGAHSLALGRHPGPEAAQYIGLSLISVKTFVKQKGVKSDIKASSSVQMTYKHTEEIFDSDGFMSDGSMDSLAGYYPAQTILQPVKLQVMPSCASLFRAEQRLLALAKRYGLKGVGWKDVAQLRFVEEEEECMREVMGPQGLTPQGAGLKHGPSWFVLSSCKAYCDGAHDYDY